MDVIDVGARRRQLLAAVGAAAALELRELKNNPFALSNRSGAPFFRILVWIGLTPLPAAIPLIAAPTLDTPANHVTGGYVAFLAGLPCKISLEAEGNRLSASVRLHSEKVSLFATQSQRTAFSAIVLRKKYQRWFLNSIYGQRDGGRRTREFYPARLVLAWRGSTPPGPSISHGPVSLPDRAFPRQGSTTH